jgi:hypothetical protein
VETPKNDLLSVAITLFFAKGIMHSYSTHDSHPSWHNTKKRLLEKFLVFRNPTSFLSPNNSVDGFAKQENSHENVEPTTFTKDPPSALRHTNVLIPIYNRHTESSLIADILRLLHLHSSSRSACPSPHPTPPHSRRIFRPILSSEHLIVHLSLATTLLCMLQICSAHRTGES